MSTLGGYRCSLENGGLWNQTARALIAAGRSVSSSNDWNTEAPATARRGNGEARPENPVFHFRSPRKWTQSGNISWNAKIHSRCKVTRGTQAVLKIKYQLQSCTRIRLFQCFSLNYSYSPPEVRKVSWIASCSVLVEPSELKRKTYHGLTFANTACMGCQISDRCEVLLVRGGYSERTGVSEPGRAHRGRIFGKINATRRWSRVLPRPHHQTGDVWSCQVYRWGNVRQVFGFPIQSESEKPLGHRLWRHKSAEEAVPNVLRTRRGKKISWLARVVQR